MTVWIPQELRATRASMPETVASKSKVQASTPTSALSAINDGMSLEGSDEAVPYYHWWPKNGGTEWLTYTFKEKATVSRSSVYWFEDQPWGGCGLPKAWRIYYLDEQGAWQPVEADAYPVAKRSVCTVNFKPVATTALKLEVDLPDNLSTGLYEWDVR